MIVEKYAQKKVPSVLAGDFCNKEKKEGSGQLTRAWKEDTEKMPRRLSAILDGRLATARRLLGFGSSLPCRLAR